MKLRWDILIDIQNHAVIVLKIGYYRPIFMIDLNGEVVDTQVSLAYHLKTSLNLNGFCRNDCYIFEIVFFCLSRKRRFNHEDDIIKTFSDEVE